MTSLRLKVHQWQKFGRLRRPKVNESILCGIFWYIFWHVQKDSFREELRDIISLSILKSVNNLSARTVCHDQKVDKVEDFGPETKVENV